MCIPCDIVLTFFVGASLSCQVMMTSYFGLLFKTSILCIRFIPKKIGNSNIPCDINFVFVPNIFRFIALATDTWLNSN